MHRVRKYLFGLGAMAAALAMALVPAVGAAASDEGTILEFDSMVGVSGQFVGPNGTPVRGLHGGGLPWEITSGQGQVDSEGNVEVEVRGLVLANTPPVPPNLRGTNPVNNFRVVVSCLDANGRVTNVATGQFPASPQGDSEIETTVQLPQTCRAPIVFVTSPTLAWFAMSTPPTDD
jgi:hypothetical protein